MNPRDLQVTVRALSAVLCLAALLPLGTSVWLVADYRAHAQEDFAALGLLAAGVLFAAGAVQVALSLSAVVIRRRARLGAGLAMAGGLWCLLVPFWLGLMFFDAAGWLLVLCVPGGAVAAAACLLLARPAATPAG